MSPSIDITTLMARRGLNARLLGFPAAPATNRDQSIHRHIQNLTKGYKPSQIIKAAKTILPELSKTVIRELSRTGLKANVSRTLRNETLIRIMYSSSDNRQHMICAEWQNSPGATRRSFQLPIWEYAAIRNWLPDFKPAGTFRGHTSEQPPSSLWEPLSHIRASLAATCVAPLQSHLCPALGIKFVSTGNNADAVRHLTDRAREYSAALAPYGDRLLIDLMRWQDYSEVQKQDLASAIYAYAVLSFSLRTLWVFLVAQPDLARFYSALNAEVMHESGGEWVSHTIDWAIERSHQVPDLPYLAEMMHSIREYARHGCQSQQHINHIAKLTETLTRSAEKNRITAFAIMQQNLDSEQTRAYFEDLDDRLKDYTGEHHLTAVIRHTDTWHAFTEQAIKHQLIELADMAEERYAGIKTYREVLAITIDQVLACGSAYASSMTEAAELPLIARSAHTASYETEFIAALASLQPAIDALVCIEPPESNALIAERTQQAQRREREIEEQNQLPETVQHTIRELETRARHAEEQLLELEQHQQQIAAEAEHYRQLHTQCEIKLEALENHFERRNEASGDRYDSQALIASVQQLISSRFEPEECLQTLEIMYPDRVRILPSAIESAIEMSDQIPGEVLFERASILATTGIDLLRSGARMIDLQDVVPGELAIQESQTVRRCDKLARHRVFRDGQSERTIFTHLSLDYSCRLYFEYDATEDRIILAYVGRHLPTAKAATV